MIFFGLFLLFVFGPGLVFYGLGLYCLTKARRKPALLISWSVIFTGMFVYTAYQGIYLKSELRQRENTYRHIARFSAPPSDVDTIMVSGNSNRAELTGNGQECAAVCLKVLLGGHFKRYVIAVHGITLFHSGPANNRSLRGYRIYTVVDEPGCRNYKNPTMREYLQPWEFFGRCVHEKIAHEFKGRYFEITTDDAAPDNPPWPVHATHIRLIDNDRRPVNIARAEWASIDLAIWFPIPGIFPHRVESGLPTDFWPDLARETYRYGYGKPSQDIIQRVLGVPLDQGIPLPNFKNQSPDREIALARNFLFHGATWKRYPFITNVLADERPLSQGQIDLIREFVTLTNFSDNAFYGTIPYIAWLAAGDPKLAPVIAALYVTQAERDVQGAEFVRALSYFGPDVLAPYAPRLLALYERDKASASIDWNFRAALNFGIGGAGPAVVDKLIAQLDAQPKGVESPVAASAAAALCRAGDQRAVAPLLAKVTTLGQERYPMSYLYALARLGHGRAALEASKRVLRKNSPTAACLKEIVDRYPNGGAPVSICIMAGPNKQPKNVQWRFSQSQLRCLAPRTPTPSG